MKAALVSVTVARFRHSAGTIGRESRSAKTWADATTLVRTIAADVGTDARQPVIVRPRWKNGLVLPETAYRNADARAITDLGGELLRDYDAQYGSARGKRLRSARAAIARECLTRCAFSDEVDASEDARAFDAARRALEACFPEHATLYIDRIRGWMLDGGKIR